MNYFPFIRLILFYICLSTTAFAENYALLIGGSSQNVESKQHEFARTVAASAIGLREKGYKTTVLFGSNTSIEENTKYVSDYKKLINLERENSFGTTSNATPDGIEGAFQSLLSKIKPGDKVEILISAHGADDCGELGSILPDDLHSGCGHTFTIIDSKGRQVQYPTEKVLSFVKSLENRGALPTLILNSCHSGRAKESFEAMGLANTCVYFQSAGNESGYGCFEDDPNFALDYTSNSEYMAMRYYQNVLGTLEKDRYFSESSCFKKTVDYMKKNHLDLSTVNKAYWSSRSVDQTFQSPALSSLLQYSYFTSGLLWPQMAHSREISCVDFSRANSKLISQLNYFGKNVSNILMFNYYKALQDYNRAVSEQKWVREKAVAFMKEERKLIDQLFKSQSTHEDPCARSL